MAEPQIQLDETKELYLSIIHPETIMFEGKVKTISSFNEKGKFDILPLHGSFVSIIKEKIVFRLMDNSVKEIKVDGGIMKVYKNRVYVFLGV